MAIVESKTFDGRSRHSVCENPPRPDAVADSVALKPLVAAPTTMAAPTFAPRRMTVAYIGPSTPYLRMQGWGLDRAGFGVRTPVCVEVSERCLTIKAVERGDIARCAQPTHLPKISRECPGPRNVGRALATEGFRWRRRVSRPWHRSVDCAMVKLSGNSSQSSASVNVLARGCLVQGRI
jgi:hypothetical protein